MSEPQIICPNCSYEIKLDGVTGGAAGRGPTRKRFSERLLAGRGRGGMAQEEEALRMQQDEIARARESIAEPGERAAAGRAKPDCGR